MPVRTLDYCALQFLNQWFEKEKWYYDAVASDDIEQMRDGLQAASGHFGVARNFPRQYEQAGRFQSVLDALANLHPDHVTSDNVVDVVNAFQEQISNAYGGRNVLSATTKFLWLKFRSPIRIYDSQARNALDTPINDYAAFNAAFTARYAEVVPQIEGACRSLVNVISYTVVPALSAQEIQELVTQIWFRERILDSYLWNAGNV